jgi:malonyl-CoA O-methyltransferase
MRSRRPLRILDPRDGYALWASSYAPSAHNPLMSAEQRAMEERLASVEAESALDIGTGSGRYLPILAACGITRVVGVDFSMPMLARNDSVFPLVCGDAERLPFADRTFDLVLASLTVGHLPDVVLWATEVARVLKPGGTLLYSDVHPSWERAGWVRTFTTADGRLFGVRQHWRTVEEHERSLAAAGLRTDAIQDVRLGRDRSRVLRLWRRRWGNPPVAILFRAGLAADRVSDGVRGTPRTAA